MTCEINQANPLPCCAKSIKIGTLAAAKTGIYIFFLNLATNRKIYRQLNTEADGTIIVDTSDINFPTDQPYEIYLRESITHADRLPFTVDGTEYQFVRTRFDAINTFAGAEAEILQSVLSMQS